MPSIRTRLIPLLCSVLACTPLLAPSRARAEADTPPTIPRPHLETLTKLAIDHRIPRIVIFFENFPTDKACKVSTVTNLAASRANRANVEGELADCLPQSPAAFNQSFRPRYVQVYSRVLSVPDGDSNALIEVWDLSMAVTGTGRHAGLAVVEADWSKAHGWKFRTGKINMKGR